MKISGLLLCCVAAVCLSACGRGEECKNELVDLGLSVKWATCNIGASSPEEFGGYYAWGELETKKEYSFESSEWEGFSAAELKDKGVIDEDDNLTAAYDVATHILGEAYRMPTKQEMMELKDSCQWTWTAVNDVNGYKVTGPNGNSIFLPAAGYYFDSKSGNVGVNGGYRSATAFEDNYFSFYTYFNANYRYVYFNRRNFGLPVRPVAN